MEKLKFLDVVGFVLFMFGGAGVGSDGAAGVGMAIMALTGLGILYVRARKEYPRNGRKRI